jgi:hypothetical protein
MFTGIRASLSKIRARWRVGDQSYRNSLAIFTLSAYSILTIGHSHLMVSPVAMPPIQMHRR